MENHKSFVGTDDVTAMQSIPAVVVSCTFSLQATTLDKQEMRCERIVVRMLDIHVHHSLAHLLTHTHTHTPCLCWEDAAVTCNFVKEWSSGRPAQRGRAGTVAGQYPPRKAIRCKHTNKQCYITAIKEECLAKNRTHTLLITIKSLFQCRLLFLNHQVQVLCDMHSPGKPHTLDITIA